MKSKKNMCMINQEFIERKIKDGTIILGTPGDGTMTIDLVKGEHPFSATETIKDAFQKKGWSKLDFAVFNALCLLYIEKEKAGFPKCQVEGMIRPFFLESEEEYKKPTCEVSHLELYKVVTGLSGVSAVSPEELQPIMKSVEKMSCTSFAPPRENREPAFEKNLQKRGIAGILRTYVIMTEQTRIVSDNKELGYMKLHEKPFLANYVEAFADAANGVLPCD